MGAGRHEHCKKSAVSYDGADICDHQTISKQRHMSLRLARAYLVHTLRAVLRRLGAASTPRELRLAIMGGWGSNGTRP